MTFFPEPLRPSEGRKEDEELRVSPIEADKKSYDKPNWVFEGEIKTLYYGAIVMIIKKFAHLLLEGKRYEEFSDDELFSDIVSLKSLLDQLTEFDQSQNGHFAQKMSNLWHELLKHMQLANRAKIKTKVDLSQLKIVLSDIDHYPPNEERKLGFYLGELAGENWLPTPFMEILRKLHDDYKINKGFSILGKWIDLLKKSIGS